MPSENNECFNQCSMCALSFAQGYACTWRSEVDRELTSMASFTNHLDLEIPSLPFEARIAGELLCKLSTLSVFC